MPSKLVQARWLALSIHAGAWERGAIAERLARALPGDGPDPDQLSARLCFHFDRDTPPAVESLVTFALREPLLDPVLRDGQVRGPLLDSPVMAGRSGNLVTFPLPGLPTWRDVGQWLCLFENELAWFSGCGFGSREVTDKRLHHYRYTWLPKRSGGWRLIEKPKSRLKLIQRTILADILNHVPPHPCAHGFTRGRSIKSYVTPHVGQKAVLRFDLKNFFPSVPAARIGAVFRHLGYPAGVAWLLQGFCTNAVPPRLAGAPPGQTNWHERKRLEAKHLPQGAPTSGPLANLCAWRLDCRLAGLAKHFGYRYTRYADDLAFSGPSSLARRAEFIESLAGSIAIDEGFLLNHRKTRLRLASQRQRLTGIVVNTGTNRSRAEWDRLKATLYNCVKYGPESQNRDKHADFRAHLTGRVAHVTWLNPTRGIKLRALLNQIVWPG